MPGGDTDQPDVHSGAGDEMQTEPPIKEEDEFENFFLFSNRPDNSIDLTPDDDQFGDDDDVRELSPQPDSDSESDSEYEPPASSDRLPQPTVIVI